MILIKQNIAPHLGILQQLLSVCHSSPVLLLSGKLLSVLKLKNSHNLSEFLKERMPFMQWYKSEMV